MNGLAIFFGILIGLAVLCFGAAVVAWNVTDIVNVGANFWNVFWLALVGILAFGGLGVSGK